jgi:hypothetical protein
LATLRKFQIVSLLDMLNFPVPEFVVEVRKLGDMFASSQTQKGQLFLTAASPDLGECLKAIDEYVTALDLDASMAAARDFIARLDRTDLPMMDYSEVASRIDELRKCIERQLQGKLFMSLSAGAAKCFSEKSLFGENVSDKFPRAIEDVEEAGKCLSLDRFTACVFHLMRVMESGVRRLAKKLRVVVNPRDNWGDILRNLEQPVQAMPRATAKQKERRDTYLSLVGLLYAVKEAWRNNVMHPKATYTEEEAKEIFNAVKVFMRRLAETI